MEKGQPPKTQTWNEDFQKSALVKLANFCHCVKDRKLVTGAEAVTHRFELLKKKSEDNVAALHMKDADQVRGFQVDAECCRCRGF